MTPEETSAKAQEIIDDPRDLWLNSPIGYLYVERIEKKDMGHLKGFLINTFTAGDDLMGDAIRQADDKAVIETYLNNNFTFDPEWYGFRPLPTKADGTPIGRLDEPDYQRKMGFRNESSQ